MPEHDPNGLAPHAPGAKLDAGKPKLITGAVKYFPNALLAVARVSEHGAQKYSWAGWREVPNAIERYDDAEGRHIVAEAIDGLYDPSTQLLHAAHRVWNSLAYLELLLDSGVPLHGGDDGEN